MSMVKNRTGSNYLTTDSLSGVAGTQALLLIGWFKRRSADTPASSNMIAQIGAGTANPRLGVSYNATPNVTGNYNNSGTGTGAASSADAWQHAAVMYGPWDGVSRQMLFWANGAAIHNTNASSTASASVTRFRVGCNVETTSMSDGKYGQWALFANPTNAATIIAAAQTLDVNSLPETPLYAWPLLDNGNSSIGSANLSSFGTIAWEAGDNPPVSASSPATSRSFIGGFF